MPKSRGLTTLLATLLLLTPGLCFAGQLQKEIDLTRSVVQGQRKGIVAASLPLSAEQQQVFWPLYDQYQAEMGDINDRTVKLLKEYSKHQDNMSDRRAGRLLDEYFAIEQAKLALRVLYRRKLAAALPEKKVARFFQIENKMDAMLETELARGVPLVK